MQYNGKEYKVLNEKVDGKILYLALQEEDVNIREPETPTNQEPTKTGFKFGTRSLKSLKGIHPDLSKVLTKAIETSPIDFTITDGLRTTAQQKALYAKGRTTSGSIVTNADGVKNKSNHQAKSDGYGYAVDLYPYYNGSVQVNDDKTLINKIAPHIKKVAKEMGINIEWGGDWKSFKDYPHFELKK